MCVSVSSVFTTHKNIIGLAKLWCLVWVLLCVCGYVVYLYIKEKFIFLQQALWICKKLVTDLNKTSNDTLYVHFLTLLSTDANIY